MILSTVALAISTAALAYCQGVAAVFVDLFGGGVGDWDPERQKQVRRRSYKYSLTFSYLC